MRAQAKKNYDENIATAGFPKKPDGKPMVYRSAVKVGVIFADSKNKARAKEFNAEFLKTLWTQADRAFAILLILQWLAGIGLAPFLKPPRLRHQRIARTGEAHGLSHRSGGGRARGPGVGIGVGAGLARRVEFGLRRFGDGGATLTVTNQKGGIKFIAR